MDLVILVLCFIDLYGTVIVIIRISVKPKNRFLYRFQRITLVAIDRIHPFHGLYLNIILFCDHAQLTQGRVRLLKNGIADLCCTAFITAQRHHNRLRLLNNTFQYLPLLP